MFCPCCSSGWSMILWSSMIIYDHLWSSMIIYDLWFLRSSSLLFFALETSSPRSGTAVGSDERYNQAARIRVGPCRSLGIAASVSFRARPKLAKEFRESGLELGRGAWRVKTRGQKTEKHITMGGFPDSARKQQSFRLDKLDFQGTVHFGYTIIINNPNTLRIYKIYPDIHQKIFPFWGFDSSNAVFLRTSRWTVPCLVHLSRTGQHLSLRTSFGLLQESRRLLALVQLNDGCWLCWCLRICDTAVQKFSEGSKEISKLSAISLKTAWSQAREWFLRQEQRLFVLRFEALRELERDKRWADNWKMNWCFQYIWNLLTYDQLW